MNKYEKIEQNIYNGFWKSLRGGFTTDQRHYASQTPDPAVVQFFQFLKKHKIKNGKVLDLGCGNGRHLVHAVKSGFTGYGIDISEEAIKLSKTNFKENNVKAHTQCGIVSSLPFSEHFFDIAIDGGCLHHLRQSQFSSYKKELLRVLKPKGYYMLLAFSDTSDYVPKFSPKSKKRPWILRKRGHYSYFYNETKIKKMFSPYFDILHFEIKQKPDTPFRFCITFMKKK